MEMKIKRVRESAKLPTKAHTTDAGFDLYADTISRDEHGTVVYGTGVAMEIPEGYVGLIFPRSSNASKDLLLSNSVGVVDSGYRGEIMVKFKTTTNLLNPLRFWWDCLVRNKSNINLRTYHIHSEEYNVGDRIAQIIIMPYPEVQFVEVDELSDSDRGTGGYGSTGK